MKIIGLLLSLLLVASAHATDREGDTERAQALLERAVERVRSVGEHSFAEFSRQGEFVDRELYVYVVRNDGTMLASGGPSISLVGRNIAQLRDRAGKPFIAEMLDAAKAHDRGAVEYRWMNWASHNVERKLAFFRRVDDKIIAVGIYQPRSAENHAQGFLDRATAAFDADKDTALTAFNRLDGGFVQDDLYVFVIDLRSGRFVAHGTMPRLIGTRAEILKDRDGKPMIAEMISIAQAQENGQIDYVWPNPVSAVVEHKRTLFRRIGDHIIAVGYYDR